MNWNPRVLFRNFRSHCVASDLVKTLYEEQEYLDAYSAHTDARIDANPEEAVGGMWEEVGQLQYRFLLDQGLAPRHTLLDIGCGALRGGRHFIRYLDQQNYTGVDISPRAILFACQLVEREGLSDKVPLLIVNESKRLRFDEVLGSTFDYLLAQSVFTHLMREHIEECIAHVARVMHGKSLFLFTFEEAKRYKQTDLKSFRYPLSFFEDLATKHGFALRDHSSVYRHPRGQRMVALMLRQTVRNVSVG